MTWLQYDRLGRASINKKELKWLHTREIVAIIYNVNRGKNKMMTGKDLYPLSFDNETEREPLTLEQHKDILKKFKIK